jgi:hypothetical protein
MWLSLASQLRYNEPVTEWLLASARISVFTAPDYEIPLGLWRETLGEEPETSAFQRATGTKVETGVLDPGKITLQTQPTRIDWLYEADEIMSGLANLGPFPQAIAPLIQLGERWSKSKSFPDTPRVALGVILVAPTDNRSTGYKTLGEFIDGAPTDPNATDFSYQVNIPRDCQVGIDNLQINRLSRWSVTLMRLITVNTIKHHQTSGPDSYFLRLELDINTSALFEGLLPREKVSMILSDLLEGAKEIRDKGAHVSWTR